MKGQVETYKGEKVEKRKGEKIANALALLSHIVAAASFHFFTFPPFHPYVVGGIPPFSLSAQPIKISNNLFPRFKFTAAKK